ncbi:PREDICTED: equilibrative nucleoside transporter 1-like [Cyprinodon variegatus]|uniref:equilibrative nucleoside transporter 1-like n=1 Tax=Cyprinodon variegatus TaxID=28743 RepID=UPI000742AF2C|nr:PREDICTED: equilibrative nucleoside transporter 1-like [Cyprinodon variegatus]
MILLITISVSWLSSGGPPVHSLVGFSVTMATNSPKDKYLGVWMIFFMLGLGTLLPWNFFMTATMYFQKRLKEPLSAEVSVNQSESAPPSVLEAKFNNVMTLCAMLPLLLCTCLNSFLHSLVLQGSLFGMAGLLPASYTTPIMSGQGLAGTFAAFAMICAIASGSEMESAAFGYFIVACVVVFLSILSYIMLPKLEFFQFFQEQNRKPTSDDEQNAVTLMNTELKDATTDETDQSISMMKIFKKIWVLALSVCCTFTVSIGIFPAITSDTKSTLANGGPWERYFIPVSCFLLFNLCDWTGRSLTAVCMWPGRDSLVLPFFIVARVLFIPLFMLCNVQPRLHLPVYFQHDGYFIAFMVLFAFSNGYLASLCMCYGPKKVLPHEAETAGAIMAFFLSLGLASGAAASFLFRALV